MAVEQEIAEVFDLVWDKIVEAAIDAVSDCARDCCPLKEPDCELSDYELGKARKKLENFRAGLRSAIVQEIHFREFVTKAAWREQRIT